MQLELPELTTLSEKHRVFVLNYIGNGRNGAGAAIAAGYAKSGASAVAITLLHREDVGHALLACAKAMISKGALIGVDVMIEIAEDVGHKDRYAAAKHLAAIGGLVATQKHEVKVERVVSQDEKLKMLQGMAEKMGLPYNEFAAKYIGPNRLKQVEAVKNEEGEYDFADEEF